MPRAWEEQLPNVAPLSEVEDVNQILREGLEEDLGDDLGDAAKALDRPAHVPQAAQEVPPASLRGSSFTVVLTANHRRARRGRRERSDTEPYSQAS